MQDDMAINAKKEALSELIKMMQDLMVKMDAPKMPVPEGEEEEMPEAAKMEEGCEDDGNEAQNGSSLEQMVKSEMKRGGKIKPPKSAMLAVSMKSSAPKKPSNFKRYG